MENIKGYKIKKEIKKDIICSRMDESMILRLKEIRDKTGISVSEIIRESVRRLIHQVEEDGGISLSI